MKSVEPFTYDMIFGSEPGTKATLEIHEIRGNAYCNNKVLALVQLPPNLEESLKDRIDQEIQFEGTLFKVDGFMKNLFISQGLIL